MAMAPSFTPDTVVDDAFMARLFPHKDTTKRAAWLVVLLKEEVGTVGEMAAIGAGGVLFVFAFLVFVLSASLYADMWLQMDLPGIIRSVFQQLVLTPCALPAAALPGAAARAPAAPAPAITVPAPAVTVPAHPLPAATERAVLATGTATHGPTSIARA